MADQRKNAGNIGDVIKHAILPALALIFDKSQNGAWLYCETHAGFYEYPLNLLHNADGNWSGERAWGIGLIHQQHYQRLGLYGRELQLCIPQDVYPGSIRLVDAVVSSNATIHGRDKLDDPVASFGGKSRRIAVSKGDGYEMIGQLPRQPRLVFCDPFWEDEDESAKAQDIVQHEDAVIVWYPLSDYAAKYRKWQDANRLSFVEVQFSDYKPRKGGWSGQGDLKGAGLTIKGLPAVALIRSLEIGVSLKSIFDGRSDRGRKFDLRVTISCEK